jgi:hypothetical protein
MGLMAVKTFRWCAGDTGVSLATWKRNVRRGDSPPVIKVGKRRKGHEESDYYDWKKSKRLAPPSPAVVSTTEEELEAAP